MGHLTHNSSIILASFHEQTYGSKVHDKCTAKLTKLLLKNQTCLNQFDRLNMQSYAS